jgi:titin
LVAFNDHGPSDKTANITGTPASVPGAPIDVMVRMVNGHMVIDWKSPKADGGSHIIDHRVFRRTSTGEFEQIGSVPEGTLTYNDTLIEAGETYTYAVRSANRMGTSIFSDKVTVAALMIPGEPDVISLKPGEGTVEISWSEPAGNGGSPITGYRIERKGPSSEEALTIAEVGQSVRSYKDEDVVNGGSYSYAVIAVNALGGSAPVWSDPIVPVGRPGTPISLILTVNGKGVSLGWITPVSDGGSEIILYRVYRSFEGGPMVLVGTVEPGMNAYTDRGLEDDGTYTYMVAAVNDIGESQAAAQGSVAVKGDGPSNDLIKDNIGLFITVPMIVVLAIVLVLVMVRKKGSGVNMVPVPSPSPVMDAIDESADPAYPENVLLFERSMDNEQ